MKVPIIGRLLELRRRLAGSARRAEQVAARAEQVAKEGRAEAGSRVRRVEVQRDLFMGRKPRRSEGEK